MKLGKIFVFLLSAFIVGFWVQNIHANNLQVSNVGLTGEVPGSHAFVKFDISWDNSWRNDLPGAGNVAPFNYDAAWVFVKFSIDGGVTWRHASLSPINSKHSVTFENGVAAAIQAMPSGDGVFIFRAANGAGSNNWDDVGLLWKYANDGVTSITPALIVNVFALEMVFIPIGGFQAGDHATSSAAFQQGASDPDPWEINGENAISVTNAAADSFYYLSAGNVGEEATGSTFTIPNDFPKGFTAFYIMKYEITQGQYVDFLNQLTRPQQEARTSTQVADRYAMTNTASASFRNGIRVSSVTGTGPLHFGCDLDGDGIFNEDNDGENLPANFLNWADGVAYADWAGLRPMTELEYEKACRGASESPSNRTAVSGEYAWGNANINFSAYNLTAGTAGGPNETVSNATIDPTGNAAYQTTIGAGLNGPLRSGIFATTSSTRIEAGASFYGVMELSGNLAEKVITVGNPIGRNFTSNHGDGELEVNGEANEKTWPLADAIGSGERGGDWRAAAAALQVSNRARAALANVTRNETSGFRCVRTAP
jgi:formylglycine-generating enzyme required for sulfatase activity